MSEDQEKKLGSGLGREKLTDHVLSGVKQRQYTGEQTIAWLKNVSENVQADIRTSEDLIPHMTMLSFVDTLFDSFLRYSLQYNRIAATRESKINYVRPQYAQNDAGSIMCRGRLDTSDWSLAVFAENDVIYTYIMPSFVKDIEEKRHEYKPLLELRGHKDRDGVLWRAEETLLLFDHVSLIAKKLFARLVRVMDGKATSTDSLSLGLSRQKAPSLGHTQRIRAASVVTNVDELLEQNQACTSYAFSELLDIIESDYQEIVKMGVAALRSGDQEVNRKLTLRSKALSGIKKQLQAIAEQWREEVE